MDARPTILGVDDSLTIRKALEIILKPAGYELELASDGAEALAKAKAVQPAVILLDFILPDLRGTDVCRQLAADPDTAHIPIVLISAKGAEIEQAYRDVSNVVAYIAKPFKPPVLTGIVAEVLARAATGDLAKLSLTNVLLPSPHVSPQVTPEPGKIGEAEEMRHDELASNNDADAVPDDFAEVEPEDTVELEVDAATAATQRERIEWMFETLRSGLEGVYVEEVDTPAGAAADQTRSYADLIEQLNRQLEEGLNHARSGARYRLYGDGSIRSFDEALLDVFRRSCRVLFRAAAAGIGVQDTAPRADRVLVACARRGRLHEELQSVLATNLNWSVVCVTENFRQLPLLVRLYGPSILVAEVTWTGALWDQLRTIQRMPEAQTIRTIGVTDPSHVPHSVVAAENARTALLAERGFSVLVHSALEVETALNGYRTLHNDPATDAQELRLAV